MAKPYAYKCLKCEHVWADWSQPGECPECKEPAFHIHCGVCGKDSDLTWVAKTCPKCEGTAQTVEKETTVVSLGDKWKYEEEHNLKPNELD